MSVCNITEFVIDKSKINSSVLGYGTLAAVIIGVIASAVLFSDRDDVALEPLNNITMDGLAISVATLEQLKFRIVDYSKLGVVHDESGLLTPGMDGENIVHTNKALKTETVTVALALGGRTEIKVVMQASDAIVFEWKASTETYYDYHAHQPGDVQVEGYFTRYAEGEASVDRGVMVAPYTGEHGWYFMNLNQGPVEIELTISGYYDKIVTYDLGG
ncbi:MAG: hypothetical protein P8J68_02065 [Arenicellaceae bacterium]|nr:hypothetical protein [Arenicellaceae bacterium]